MKTWRQLVDRLNNADEDECWRMLDEEKEAGNRPTFLMRIYGRAAKLREQRERQELLR